MFSLLAPCSLGLVALAVRAEITTNPDTHVPCQRFENLYDNGEDLCNTMFGESFRYVPRTSAEYPLSYTMWFFSHDNPNDATTELRKKAGLHPNPSYQDTNTCWLAGETTDHKKVPSAEGPGFTECHPYKNRGCCKEATVENLTTINNKYGPEYRWDVCGKMSSECERFMVQEACFYECDANVGLFRQFPPLSNGSTRWNETGMEWMIEKVPIQGDYCDAWWQACRNDLFCAVGDGDVFECSAYYEEHNPAVRAQYTAGEIAGIVIGSVAIFLLLASVVTLIVRERRGTPVFGVTGLGDADNKSQASNNRTPLQQQQEQVMTI